MSRESRPTWSQLINPSIFRNILDGLHEGVALLEPETEPPGPFFIYSNAAFSRITGYKGDEVVGLPFETLVGTRVEHPVVASFLHQVRHGLASDAECSATRKEGGELTLNVSLRPVFQDDEMVYTICVLRDRTAERRMEAIAHAANLAESAATIFGGLRHEIGNPINSIKAALSLLHDRRHTFPPEKTSEYLERALAEIDRIEFLLRAMRSFSARERPKMEDVDPKPLLDRFLLLSGEDLARKAISVSTWVDPACGTVRADPRALYQVLLNLLINATDAVQGRPDASIRITITAADARVIIRIVDNGCGVQQEDLERLFDPFFTTKATGTGLGLAICRRLCAAMNGTIRLESEPGRGSVAVVDLAQSARPGGPRDVPGPAS